MLPSYNLVITRLKKFIQMYSDFMTCSHLDKELRNKKIEEWVDSIMIKVQAYPKQK